MADRRMLAIDLGGSGGRCICGTYDGKKLRIEQIHKFDNPPIDVNGFCCWNEPYMWTQIENGLCRAGKEGELHSVGVDSWGCDFVLLDNNGGLAEQPISYRDKKTNSVRSDLNSELPAEQLYALLGIRELCSSTVMRLYYLNRHLPSVLKKASNLLFLPDYFNYRLSGEQSCEYTIASTAQLLNLQSAKWDNSCMKQLEIPIHLFPEVSTPGVQLGKLRLQLAQRTGLTDTKVYSVCGHDSASALVAVPAIADEWLCISSGTWSIMACELKEKRIYEAGLTYGFSHEGCYGGKIRLTNNLIGLWPMQRLQSAAMQQGRQLSYDEMESLAENIPVFRSIIVPGYDLMMEHDICSAIDRYCVKTSQPVPKTLGEYVRCVIDSLSLSYAVACQQMEEVSGQNFQNIHIVGGGAKSETLCQLTANTTQKQVIAGPYDAASLGNILVQLIGCGELDSVCQARQLIRDSFDVKHFIPQSFGSELGEALQFYEELQQKGLVCGKMF